jgi:hypothetical protein
MKQSTIICISVLIVIIVIAFIVYNKRESFLFIPPLEVPVLIQPPQANLACQLGANKCTMANGELGLCNSHVTGLCDAVAEGRLPYDDVYHLPVPLGEPCEECYWTSKVVCPRLNGEFGVCMSGKCYPNPM